MTEAPYTVLDTSTAHEANMTEANVTESNSVFLLYKWMEILYNHAPIALYVDRVITPIWYILGIIGNTLSLKIWTEPRMRKNNSSAYYLAALAVSDLIFLLLHIAIELTFAWDFKTIAYPVVCELYMIIYLIPQYLSPILVLGFTVERFIAVCHPFKKEKYCSKSRALKTICGLLVICTALCLVQGYFWSYNDKNDVDTCEFASQKSNGDRNTFWYIWTWVTEMLVFAVVPITILVLNIFVISEVCKVSKYPTIIPSNEDGHYQRGVSTSGGSSATTAMLLTVSFYLICTTIPATIVYVMANIYQDLDYNVTDAEMVTNIAWQNYFTYLTIRKCIEELCLSHYACNFFLYCLTGTQFRKSLKNILRGMIKVKEFCCSEKYKDISYDGSRPYSSCSQTTRLSKIEWSQTKV